MNQTFKRFKYMLKKTLQKVLTRQKSVIQYDVFIKYKLCVSTHMANIILH